MNVASLELCKELYELSGWKVEDNYWVSVRNHHALHILNYYRDPVLHKQKGYKDDITIPAYDLGYLLRKLPERIELRQYVGGDWDCRHIETDEAWGVRGVTNADTPEDAACKLAIELFKQNVLTKEIQSS